MTARQTKNELMDDEWEFDSYKELLKAVRLEARVCGDAIRIGEDDISIEIYNHHQSSVRWKGSVNK